MIGIDRLNQLASIWSGFMVRGLIDATVLLLVVGVVWLAFRKWMSSQLTYGLFLLVLLKLAVPVPIAVPAEWLKYSPGAAADKFVATSPTELKDGRLDALGVPVPRASDANSRSKNLSIAPAAAPTTSAATMKVPTLSVAAGLMIGWAAVVAGLLARLVTRHVKMHFQLRSLKRREAGDLPIVLSTLARKTGMRDTIPLVDAPWIGSPAVWGLIRPVVLIPPALDAALSPNAMAWVLLHELTHIRRRDSWVALFQRLVQIVYFFHPAVWTANRIIDAQREYACDDAATAIANVPRYDCGSALLSIVERANTVPPRPYPALGLTRSNTLIRSRLVRILDGGRRPRTSLSLGSAVLLLLATAVGLPQLRARDEWPEQPTITAGVGTSVPSAASGPPLKAPTSQVEAQVEPKPAQPRALTGIVRDSNGLPVDDVAITGTQRYREIDFDNGVLGELARSDGLYASTDANGRYILGPTDKRIGVFAYHESGYARKSAEEVANSADLTLEPWGRVEGTVKVLGEPLANVPIRFTLDATDQHSMFYEFYEYDAKTDAEGRFTISHVPAGVAQASTGTRFQKDPGPYGIVSSRRRLIRPGQTLDLDVGGAGRPVVGKIRVLEGPPISVGGGRIVLKTNETAQPAEPSAKEMETWEMDKRFLHHFDPYRSPAGLARRLADRIHHVQVRADGTFRAVEVLPGTYTLSFWAGQDFTHPIASHEFVVVPIAERRTDVPLDLGTIVIKPPVTPQPSAAGRDSKKQ
jgi:beta-lactamase regulating signal transducer with metallopeptidase domain